MAAFIAICSWVSIPIGEVPITMQTFGIFLSIGILGGKLGTISVLVYVLLGAVGVPVFAGFTGGLGIIMGNNGGYIIGFIFASLAVWAIQHFFGDKLAVNLISMFIGMIVYDFFGTIWFIIVYTNASGAVSLMTVLGWCVFPFIIPDIIKIIGVAVISQRIKKHVKL